MASAAILAATVPGRRPSGKCPDRSGRYDQSRAVAGKLKSCKVYTLDCQHIWEDRFRALPFGRDMVSAPHFRVLATAFFMGLAAAAPLGPVNMLAIRRGMLGSWYDTVACGIGSVVGDLTIFSLALLGGRYFLSDISNPALRTVLTTISVVVLFPLGIYFLVHAVKQPLPVHAGHYKRWESSSTPKRLVLEMAAGAALTILNPLTLAYWVLASSNWLPYALSVLGSQAPRWGILMAGCGLVTWFTMLVLFVRFIPRGIGPTFFRLVNTTLGLILVGFATYCAIALLRRHSVL